MTDAVREHWNAQAGLGPIAGTRDLMAKAIEEAVLLDAMARHVPAPARVLELGCGRGELLAQVAARYPQAEIWAIDVADQMAAAAAAAVPRATVRCGDVRAMPADLDFDLIYSERCLINLPNWRAQLGVLDLIAARLTPHGRYLMCENSQDGLDHLNRARAALDLPTIDRPWHNCYFRDADVGYVTSLRLLERRHDSATYYFLSRVVQAALAHRAGTVPAYDAPINQVARDLTMVSDAVDPRFAQSRLWVWERA